MNTVFLRSKGLKSLEIFFDESRSLQQVLGGIADQGKLRKDSQRTPGPLGLLRGIQNQTGVVREVTDDRIDLAESDFHGKCLKCTKMPKMPKVGEPVTSDE
jgi:hypothetical protein